jgi:hypothetical protein
MDNCEIGRVLRASTAGFAVGCRVSQLSIPAFGNLVKAQPADEREAIYGLIYDMYIDDDPLVRRLVMAEDPNEELISDQRRNRMLPVEMSVLAVGVRQDERIRYGYPPQPPLNLDPVQLCAEREELTQFTDNLAYLRLILRAADNNVPVEQLLVAHIVDAYQVRGEDTVWAASAIHEVIELLRSDYETLIPTLEALSVALPGLPQVNLPFG